MQHNTSPVSSSQMGVHPRLREGVLRHLEKPFRRVPSEAGRRAFARVEERLAAAPFVLDAGCGTGAGTFALALAHPQQLVLGIDKSAARLSVGQRVAARTGAPANSMLLHCELVDFWQLAAAANLCCARQYLLYPNPWPKPQHLQRRWHAHPVLPSILALGGTIELRTNWRVYAGEFAIAMDLAGANVGAEEPVRGQPHLTPFERKFALSGHALWRCCAIATQCTAD